MRLGDFSNDKNAYEFEMGYTIRIFTLSCQNILITRDLCEIFKCISIVSDQLVSSIHAIFCYLGW